jgi:hypothetical protein
MSRYGSADLLLAFFSRQSTGRNHAKCTGARGANSKPYAASKRRKALKLRLFGRIQKSLRR